ncbi:MAG: 4Fe-4S binding protein [Lachnospiraceae bacterium]|nr:4Fe-4S binding protein [Lachnospiraceae bacterium]
MSVYEIVFSPTGGTQKAADSFTDAFCKAHVYLDLTRQDQDFSAYSFQEEDVCIVAVPSYGGRVPEPAVSRLRQMIGNKARAILMVVYGNRAYEDTFVELQDVLEDAGFSCVAAVASVAEHSIIRQFAAGRPDAADEKELADFAVKVRSKIESGTSEDALYVPGNRPYKEYGGVPIKPRSGKACIRCGLCARECPAGAIPTEDPSKTDEKVCISCMRCIGICPKKARSVSKTLLAASSMKMKKVCSGRKSNELFL